MYFDHILGAACTQKLVIILFRPFSTYFDDPRCFSGIFSSKNKYLDILDDLPVQSLGKDPVVENSVFFQTIFLVFEWKITGKIFNHPKRLKMTKKYFDPKASQNAQHLNPKCFINRIHDQKKKI